MADYKVGEAPWEQKAAPTTFKVGEAPWEQKAPQKNMIQANEFDTPHNAPTSLSDDVKQIGSMMYNTADAGLSGAANMMTLNHAPIVEAGMSAAGGAVKDLATGNLIDPDKFSKTYDETLAQSKAHYKELHDQYAPIYNTGAAVGGFYNPLNKALAPATGLYKYINGAEELKNAGWLTKTALGTANGAVLGGAINPGDEVKPQDELSARLNNAKWGGVIGGGVTGGLEGVKAYAPSVLSALLGPSKEVQAKYLAGRARILAAPTVAAMKDGIDQHVGQLQDSVANGEISVKHAQGMLDSLDQQVQATAKNAGQEFSESIPDFRQTIQDAQDRLAEQKSQAQGLFQGTQSKLKDQLASAKEEQANQKILAQQQMTGQRQGLQSQLGDARDALQTERAVAQNKMADQVAALKEQLSGAQGELQSQTRGAQNTIADQEATLASVPHPRVMADDVHGAVGTLKDQVVNESQKATQILSGSNIGVQTAPVIQKIDDAINSHIIAGQEPITPDGKATVAALRQMKADLLKYPGMLSGEDAKRFVQQLDKGASYNTQAGQFSDDYSNAVKSARRAIDGQLKGYKPYEDQMKIVADKADLLGRANKVFGTPEKAHSAMNTITGEAKGPQQELLNELGIHTGNDFGTPLTTYQNAQQALKEGVGSVAPGLLPASQKIAGIKKTLSEGVGEVADHLLPASRRVSDLQQALREGTGEVADHLLPASQKVSALQQTLNEGVGGVADHLLPASRDVKTGKDLLEIAPFLKKNYIDQVVAESGLPAKQAAQQAELSRLQQELAGAQQKAQPLAGWGPNSTQSKLQSLISTPGERENIESMRTLKEHFPEFAQAIDDNRTRSAFTKDYTRGSRGVNLWGAVLGSAARAMEKAGVTNGAGHDVGKIFGSFVDRKGGEWTKNILDHYLDNPQIYTPLKNLPPSSVTTPWIGLRSTRGNQ